MSASLVLQHCPRPDHYDRQVVPLPAGSHHDPWLWAKSVFDVRSSGLAVKALLGLRQLLVPLIGVPRTTTSPFTVQEVAEGEALVAASERHLDFWCGVRALGDELEVSTAVSLHGWRGRLYWVPVGILHGPITRAMMRRAVRRTRERGLAGGARIRA